MKIKICLNRSKEVYLSEFNCTGTENGIYAFKLVVPSYRSISEDFTLVLKLSLSCKRVKYFFKALITVVTL